MQLTIIQQILFENLRPWLEDNRTEARFIHLLFGVDRLGLAELSKFKLNVPKPYNKKLRYYDLLLWNAVWQFRQDFFAAFNTAKTIDHQKFLVDRYMEREITQKLRNTAEIIVEQQTKNNDIDKREIKETSAILDSIRYHLSWLYLELKSLAEPVIGGDYMDLDTISEGIFDGVAAPDNLICELT